MKRRSMSFLVLSFLAINIGCGVNHKTEIKKGVDPNLSDGSVASVNILLSQKDVAISPVEYEITGGKVVEYLGALKHWSGINSSIKIKGYASNSLNGINYGPRGGCINIDESSNITIFVGTEYVCGRMSNDAIQSLLAHELGHLKLGHCLPDFQTSFEYRANINEGQIRANIFAIDLIGLETFKRGWSEMGFDIKLELEKIKSIKDSKKKTF